MKIDPVNEQRNASLFLMAGAERPLVPYDSVSAYRAGQSNNRRHTFSIRNPRIFESHLHLAQTTNRSLAVKLSFGKNRI